MMLFEDLICTTCSFISTLNIRNTVEVIWNRKFLVNHRSYQHLSSYASCSLEWV
jgi:hypothetical protein